MAKKIVSLVLIICMLAAMTVTVNAGGNIDPRDGVVVVSIWIHGKPNNRELGTGTGFFITDQYLVTNWHVIETYLKFGAGDEDTLYIDDVLYTGKMIVKVYFDDNDTKEAYVVAYDEKMDLAILRLAEPTTKRSPLQLLVPTQEMIANHTNIYAVGFPSVSDNEHADTISARGKTDASVNPGVISKFTVQSGTGQQNIEVTAMVCYV